MKLFRIPRRVFQEFHRRTPRKIIISGAFLFFCVWFLLQILAPLMLPTGTITNLSGVVGFDDNTAIIRQMSFPWNFVYTAGDRLCHQQANRSFFLNGNQMSFCSRCTALWLGITIGVGFMIFFTLALSGRVLWWIFIGFIPLGIDGLGQLFGFWESTNQLRFFTGMIAGFITGLLVGVIIDEVHDMIAKKKKLK